MIEDKDVKIAENSEEAFWKGLEQEMIKSIENAQHEIIINNEILALAVSKQEKIKIEFGDEQYGR